MARSGRSTLSTLRIFTTEMVLDLNVEQGWGICYSHHLSPAFTVLRIMPRLSCSP